MSIFDGITRAIQSHEVLELTGCHGCGKRFTEKDNHIAHHPPGGLSVIYCEPCFEVYLKEKNLPRPFEDWPFDK